MANSPDKLGARIEELTSWVTELVPLTETAPGEALLVRLCAIAALFSQVARKPEAISTSDRHRIRETARKAMIAGAGEAELTEGIRRLTGEAVRRAPKSPAVVDASFVVLADCLAVTESSRLTRVRRLLFHGDLPPSTDQSHAETYTVAVFRIQERRRALIIGMLAELDGRLVDECEVIAGPCENDAVIIVPGAEGARHARRLVDEIGRQTGMPLCAAAAACARDKLMAGYSEAARLLDLALAAERAPGLYHIDDFLMEYAAMRDPVVSARLTDIVQPLLGKDRLYETLKAFVRCGYNRARTARELFIHRTTVDYRIRRIEAVTGYDPASGRGSQVLTAAVTLFSLQGAH